MRWALTLLTAGTAVCAGCGDTAPTDKTPALIDCLKASGGVQIARARQLDRLPSVDPQQGVGFSLQSISFVSADVAAGHADVRQALVFVERPRDQPLTTPLPAADELLRRARRGTLDVRALVLMPASRDFDRPLSKCAEQTAADEIFP